MPTNSYETSPEIHLEPISPDKKFFIVDTNVFLSDPMAVFGFEEHVVVITMTVLEELDRKKSCERIGREARACIDLISKTINGASHQEVNHGVPIVPVGAIANEKTGLLRIYDDSKSVIDREGDLENLADNRIIAATLAIKKSEPDRAVTLVTKDINMRLKALTLGAEVQDYANDRQLSDIDMIYCGCRNIHEIDDGSILLEQLTNAVGDTVDTSIHCHPRKSTVISIPISKIPESIQPKLLLNSSLYDPDSSTYWSVINIDSATDQMEFISSNMASLLERNLFGVKPRSFEQAEALRALTDPEISLVVLVGPAGSGKTLLALAAGLEQSDANGNIFGKKHEKNARNQSASNSARFERIIASRKLTDMTEAIGFLPGTEEEKMAPWLGAFSDSLELLAGGGFSAGEGKESVGLTNTVNLLIEAGNIQFKSLNFMRGRSLNSTFMVLDESQNLNPHQMRSMLTRIGEGSKIVVMGNLSQIDDKYITALSSGLTWAVEHMKGFKGAAIVHLPGSERSELAAYAEGV